MGGKLYNTSLSQQHYLQAIINNSTITSETQIQPDIEPPQHTFHPLLAGLKNLKSNSKALNWKGHLHLSPLTPRALQTYLLGSFQLISSG